MHLCVDAELRARGHDVLVMDLPVDDDSAGLSAYLAVVMKAIGDRATRDNLVVRDQLEFQRPRVP